MTITRDDNASSTAPAASGQHDARTRRRRTAIVLGVIVLLLALAGVGAITLVRYFPDAVASLPGGRSVPDVDDGRVPDGQKLSVFESDVPAIERLDPELRDAIRRAAVDAEADGIEFEVTSGWRSASYQQFLLDDAIWEYGSLAEARKFVSTPELSHHVSGNAVDIGPPDARQWLLRNGVDYGLCQIYANELWHFELATTPGGRCPSLLADAS